MWEDIYLVYAFTFQPILPNHFHVLFAKLCLRAIALIFLKKWVNGNIGGLRWKRVRVYRVLGSKDLYIFFYSNDAVMCCTKKWFLTYHKVLSLKYIIGKLFGYIGLSSVLRRLGSSMYLIVHYRKSIYSRYIGTCKTSPTEGWAPEKTIHLFKLNGRVKRRPGDSLANLRNICLSKNKT